jgi:hypothetical protein
MLSLTFYFKVLNDVIECENCFIHYQNRRFFTFISVFIYIFYFLCFFIMPRKYVREYSEHPRASWTEETLRQAISRINAGEIGIRKGY